MNFNLEEIAKVVDIHIKSKNKEDPDDAKLRRFIERWLFVATLIAIAIVFGSCILLLAFNPASTYAGIAINGIISLSMALAGYYVRGKSNS